MQLRPDQLAAHLAKTLAPVYVLHGDEPLLVGEAADAVRRAARARGFAEREVLVTHSHFKWNGFQLAAGNLSLFGASKLIDLRIPSGKPGRDGGEVLQQYVRAPNPDVVVLICLPELDWQARKSAWFLALDEAGVAIELNAPALARLPAWIAERLARQQQSAPPSALELIASHVEGNLLAAHQEILKLGLLYPAGPLTHEQVEGAVLNVARYDVGKLQAALLDGDAARCARLLDGLKGEGVALPLILWTFANTARSIAAPRGPQAQRAAARLSRREIHGALQRAARVDRMIKGVSAGDPWDELLQLALFFAKGTHREIRRP